jgi:hypothetical protein
MAVVTTIVLRPPKAVAMPVQFTPPEEVIAGPVGITMSSQTADAEIHYTVDGTAPTLESPAYRKTPVEVRPGVTLRAKAFRRGMKTSDETHAVYRLPSETQPGAAEIPADLEAAIEAPAPSAPAPAAR